MACWIHARRYWHQAIDNDEVRANTALSFIARLLQIEVQLREPYPRANLQGERDFGAVAAARQPVTSEELDALLPDRWLQSHPDHAWTMDAILRQERHAKEKNRRQERRR